MSVWKLSTWMEIGFRVEFHSTVTSTSPPWLTYSPPFFFLLQVEIIILGWTWVKRSFTIPSTTAVKASAALWMFIRARRKAKLHFFHIVFTSNKTESRERWLKRRRKWNSSLFVLLPRLLVVFSRISKLLFASGEGENSLRQHRAGRMEFSIAWATTQTCCGKIENCSEKCAARRGNWTATKCGGRGHKIFIFVDFLLPFKTQFRSAKWAHDLNVLEWVADDIFRSLPWWRREMVNSISHQHPTRINFLFSSLLLYFKLKFQCQLHDMDRKKNCIIQFLSSFFSSPFLQLVGLGLFAFSLWIRVEPGFEEWIKILDIYSYYIGVYILIAVSVVVLLTSFLGCCSALMEHGVALLIVSMKRDERMRLFVSSPSEQDNDDEAIARWLKTQANVDTTTTTWGCLHMNIKLIENVPTLY